LIIITICLNISCKNQDTNETGKTSIEVEGEKEVFYDGPEIAFVGQNDNVAELEDDAKAVANWMKDIYGDSYTYLGAKDINRSSIKNFKVIFFYELKAPDGAVSEQEAKIDLGGLQDDSVVVAIEDWVKDGGNLLLAGDAANFIFEIGRVPRSYAYGEQYYGHHGAEDIPPHDIWGLSVVDYTNSEDRSNHPIFKTILDEDKRIGLYNAMRREVRLVWWNVGPAGGDCCRHIEMITNFENELNAIKLASLFHINDYFGIAAFELKPTSGELDQTFSEEISKDYSGTVLVFGNSIIGYEWAPNDGSKNEYQANIEKLTQNAIDYLMEL
jgi:hypothetical protein